MSDQDPTEPIETSGGGRPPGAEPPPGDEPTSVMRPAPAETRTTERTTTRPGTVPPGPPGGVSTGVAVAAAIVVGLLGLLAGYLVWGTDDDADAEQTTETTAPPDLSELEDLANERDELAQQVEEQQTQIDELQSELEDVTAERDELRSEADEGDEVTTVPAPDVVGGTRDDADELAAENGWTLVEREATDAPDDAEPGTVIAQFPEPGTAMVEGSVLVVDVVPDGG